MKEDVMRKNPFLWLAVFLAAPLAARAGLEVGAMVVLEDGKGNIVLKAKADKRGAFSFQGVKKGDYVLKSYGPGPHRPGGKPRVTRKLVLGGPGFEGGRGSIHGSFEGDGLHAYCAPDDPKPVRDRPRVMRRGGLDFSLADHRLPVGENPVIRIRGGVPFMDQGQRFWVTVVQAGAPDDAWGYWQYLHPGQTEVILQAPDREGEWEVRLHDVYPRHDYRVLHRESLRVGRSHRDRHARSLRFALQDHHLRREQIATVVFRDPIPSVPGQQYWITIAPEGSDDSTWGSWQYLEPGAREVDLKKVGPGRYEVRLHDLYPRHSHGVLHRETLVVR
jgi:hypothetical protein